MNYDNAFLKEIIKSYENVLLSQQQGKNFNRSPKKVDNLHERIARDLNIEFIKNHASNIYLAKTKETNNREDVIPGFYYDKRADIAIFDMSKKVKRIIAIVELKFVLSSLYKNISNYFEQSMGECVNLKMKKYKYYDVNIYLNNTPSYSKNGLITGIDRIDLKKFNNYIKRSNMDSSSDPERVTVPNKTLFLVINNNKPLKNETKNDFAIRELKLLQNSNYNVVELYNDNLITSEWGKNTFINQYGEFISEIANDILKGRN